MFILTITLLFLIGVFVKTAAIVPAGEAMIKERLGRFAGVMEPGLHFLIPFIDSIAYRHETREQVIEVPPQNCISRDNVQIEVDGIIYLKVLDAQLASYGIENYRVAAINLAQTTLRSELGKLELHETYSERDTLNRTLVEEIDKASSAWGVKVLRYEVMNITPSAEVVHTLEKAMEAERDRRAEVTLAMAEKEAVSKVSEGKRQEAINLSEGERQRRINEAEGQAAQIAIVAEATAYSIKRIGEALAGKGGAEAKDLRMRQQYIDMLGQIIDKCPVKVLPKEVAIWQALAQSIGLGAGPTVAARAPEPGLSSGDIASRGI